MTYKYNRRKNPVRDIYSRLYDFFGPQGWWPAETRLEVIVGAILTQNTAWTNVEKAIANLKKAGAISSPVKLKNMNRSRLAGLIRPAGYYNIKAGRIKNFINFLFNRYNGRIDLASRQDPDTLRLELLSVNGIGPETCDSILLYAFRRPVFVVDAYTKRIFSRHGFFPESASYGEVQMFFEKNIPAGEAVYNQYHALIVRLAKEFCKKAPKCAGCPLKVT